MRVPSSDAGWSSPVARWAHNPKVAGSNPAPATIKSKGLAEAEASPLVVWSVFGPCLGRVRARARAPRRDSVGEMGPRVLVHHSLQPSQRPSEEHVRNTPRP